MLKKTPKDVIKKHEHLMLYIDVIQEDAKELLRYDNLASAHLEMVCALEKMEEAKILIQSARATMAMHYHKTNQL